ncbi:two-component system sporulation sensor kinase A [Virgibacillus halotolerans]|uniref:ATP-binding protein n=1 Tax=Virgibacillus halotolerans TaxID=1071053 RepID=UPI0019621A48|nr:ATP-binding protein [Virgibacillus halotolerans]MBM7598449.1 two-component system sporulation sensor kinase A [Virgibacillus halotolerans]
MLAWVDQYNNGIIILLNDEEELLFVSKSVERILAYNVADLIGMHWNDIISPEDVKRYIVRDSEMNQIFNVNVLHKNGKYIWTECTVEKMEDQTTSKNYYMLSLVDITDRKDAEELMIRSEKMSVAGQLAAGIAHEIRNPLTSLKGFLQLLQAGVPRKETYYDIMIDEIDKMETITSELLFISKPLTDQRKQESVSEMIEDVVILLEPQANLNNIVILFNPVNDVNIYCDRSQIKQVLINLLKNAIEAMDEAGMIKIEIHPSDESINIKVIDEGPGVPEDLIHKLGEPFFTTKKTGTGLGIMITRQILEQHHAKLEIANNELKGSTFQINFPI